MVFGVPALVAWLSRWCTLAPGDLIFTGTPAGVGSTRNPRRYPRPRGRDREYDRKHRHAPQPLRGGARLRRNDMAVDGDKLHAFVNKAIGDIGATLTAGLVVVGRAARPLPCAAPRAADDAAELAAKTGTAERYVREWCAAQAASEYITYDAASGRYTLPPEQAVALTDDESPSASSADSSA
jgi:hypothetical protein